MRGHVGWRRSSGRRACCLGHKHTAPAITWQACKHVRPQQRSLAPPATQPPLCTRLECQVQPGRRADNQGGKDGGSGSGRQGAVAHGGPAGALRRPLPAASVWGLPSLAAGGVWFSLPIGQRAAPSGAHGFAPRERLGPRVAAGRVALCLVGPEHLDDVDVQALKRAWQPTSLPFLTTGGG